jgi:hypothetical protein
MPATMTQTSTTHAKCPRCGCGAVYRSRRRGLIERHLFRAIHLRPYRCENCDSRFYIRRITRECDEHTQLVTT